MAFRILWIASCVTTMHSVWKDEKFPELGVLENHLWPAGPKVPLMMAGGGSEFPQANDFVEMPVGAPAPVPLPTLPPAEVTATTPPCPWNCNDGYDLFPDQWVTDWSGEKKIFCCRTAHRACSDQMRPMESIVYPPWYNCSTDSMADGMCLLRGWSRHKVLWCCRTPNKRCVRHYNLHL